MALPSPAMSSKSYSSAVEHGDSAVARITRSRIGRYGAAFAAQQPLQRTSGVVARGQFELILNAASR